MNINFRKIFVWMAVLAIQTCTINVANAEIWMNSAKSMFDKNGSVALTINIRTFNAVDKNGNDIIEPNLKEVKGNFVNAVSRLDELPKLGINTVVLMPIMQTGRQEAKGTAGSLYAPVSFTQINDQLDDKSNKMTVEQEARAFINECHKRKIHVIVDMPAFGAYDLYKSYPDLFVNDKSKQDVHYGNNTDTRVFKVLNESGGLHQPVYNLYNQFVNKMIDMNVDGVRAQYASTKPQEFWRRLIEGAKKQDPEFIFIADVTHNGLPQFSNQLIYTSYDKLLEAGFDTYYGNFADYKNWKSASDIKKEVDFNSKLFAPYVDKSRKSVLATFAPQNEKSPYERNGKNESKGIAWLAATLPVNVLYIDGFQLGDMYDYKFANKRAQSSLTDSKIYYVDKGLIDTYNFSRQPKGDDTALRDEFTMASVFKMNAAIINTDGHFKELATFNRSIIGYANIYKQSSIIVLYNTDKQNPQSLKLRIKGIVGSESIVPLRASKAPEVIKGKINATLEPSEIMVILGMNLVY